MVPQVQVMEVQVQVMIHQAQVMELQVQVMEPLVQVMVWKQVKICIIFIQELLHKLMKTLEILT